MSNLIIVHSFFSFIKHDNFNFSFFNITFHNFYALFSGFVVAIIFRSFYVRNFRTVGLYT